MIAQIELEIVVVEDRYESREAPLACPGCGASLTEPGSVNEFFDPPSRRSGHFNPDDDPKGDGQFISDSDDRYISGAAQLITGYACAVCGRGVVGQEEA